MHLTEESFDVDGDTYFRRIWKCHHNEWLEIFRWDDLDAASYHPVCGRCLGGPLLLS
jgi:hypothetical protein